MASFDKTLKDDVISHLKYSDRHFISDHNFDTIENIIFDKGNDISCSYFIFLAKVYYNRYFHSYFSVLFIKMF